MLQTFSMTYYTPFLIRHGLRRATFPPGEGFEVRNLSFL